MSPARHVLTILAVSDLARAEEKPWGDTAAYFADPDGNVIAIATET